MERTLLWSAPALGIACWLCGLALTRHRREDANAPMVALPFWIAACAIPALLFLAALPGNAPFAAGQGLGKGLLLGGIGALLSGCILARAAQSADAGENRETLRQAAVVAAPMGMSVAVAAIAVLGMQATVLDSLSGVAIGWFLVSCLLAAGLVGNREGISALLPLAAGTGFALTVCGLAILGEYRAPAPLAGSAETLAETLAWNAVGLTFAAGAPFALLMSALLSGPMARLAAKLPLSGGFARTVGGMYPGQDISRSAARGWQAVLGAVLLLLLGRLLAGKMGGQPAVFPVMAIGVGAGLVACWIAAARLLPESRAFAADWQNAALAVLILLAGGMAAFQMLAGFGIGLMLLGAWLAVGFSLAAAGEAAERGGEARETTARSAAFLTRLLLFGVALLIYRVFVQRFGGEIRGVTLTDTYAYFGFFLGAIVPSLLTAYVLSPTRDAGQSPGSLILRLCLVGLISLLIPALALMIWGSKCVFALMIGLAFGLLVTDAAPKSAEGTAEEAGDRILTLLPALLAFGVLLALMQWTHHALPLASLARAEKINVVKWAVGSLAVLILAADIGGRMAQKRQNRSGKAADAATGGTR